MKRIDLNVGIGKKSLLSCSHKQNQYFVPPYLLNACFPHQRGTYAWTSKQGVKVKRDESP